MELFDCGAEDMEELSRFIRDYNAKVKTGEMVPQTVKYAFYENAFTRDDNRVIFVRDGDDIRGFLQYKMNVPIGDADYDRVIAAVIASLGLGAYKPENVATIEGMESFPPYRGTGRMMMDALKARKDVKAIRLTPLCASVGFYTNKDIGFRIVNGRYCGTNSVLVWESGER